MRAPPVPPKGYLAETVAAIRADALVYATAVVYFLAGAIYVLGRRVPMFGDFDLYATSCVVVCCIVLPYVALMVGLARIMHRLPRRRRLAFRYMFAPRRVARFVAGTLLMLLVLLLFEEMFTAVKTAFSSDGFPFDAAIANFNQFIHFGHAPVLMIPPAIQQDWILRIVEFNYDEVWVLIWMGMLYWAAIAARADRIRLRFFISFLLVWSIVGNLVAALLPTAGPALYALSTGDTQRFAGLQAFLANSHSATAATQQYLWSLHLADRSGFGSGISAFPSMHVASITLCALFIGEFGRWQRWMGAIYTAVIMLSSVYLGWHYAIDGYAAVLLTVAIYWAVKRVLAPSARAAAAVSLPAPGFASDAGAAAPRGQAV